MILVGPHRGGSFQTRSLAAPTLRRTLEDPIIVVDRSRGRRFPDSGLVRPKRSLEDPRLLESERGHKGVGILPSTKYVNDRDTMES